MEALSVQEESRVNVHDIRGNDSMKEEGSERGGRNQGVASLRRRRACVALLELPHRSGTEWAVRVDRESQLNFPFSGDFCKNVGNTKVYSLLEDASNVAMPHKIKLESNFGKKKFLCHSE